MNMNLQSPTPENRPACPAARLEAAVWRAREARSAYLAEQLGALRSRAFAAIGLAAERLMVALYRRKPEFR